VSFPQFKLSQSNEKVQVDVFRVVTPCSDEDGRSMVVRNIGNIHITTRRHNSSPSEEFKSPNEKKTVDVECRISVVWKMDEL